MRAPRTRLIAGAGLLAVGLSACGPRFGMPVPGTEQAESTLDLWNLLMWAGIIVAAIVYGLMAWAVIRYRRRRKDPEGAQGAQFRENLPIEIIYTAIPIVVVIGLFLVSLRTEQTVTHVDPEPDLIVQVEAFTWGWRFTYPNGVQVVSEPIGDATVVGEGPALTLPKDRTTRIVLTANDTIHAFWVPGFLFKRDAIPGRVSEFDLTPTTEATYRGACAELCGWNHAYMTFHVDVVSPEDFDTWLDTQARETASNRPTPSPTPTPAAPSPVEVG